MKVEKIMNKQEIECKYCDRKISYIPSANFMVFCPWCKSEILLECEYGYGPVTPCQILLGEEKIATVKESNRNYFLEMESGGEKIELKEKYMGALSEASRIINNMLIPDWQDSVNSIEIKKRSGSICFYGEWFGRPYDNYHKIKGYSYTGDTLEIVFDQWEQLIVIEPSGIINTEKEFRISSAKQVKWSWYPYGSTQRDMNKISYSIVDGQLYKISKYGEQKVQMKEPHAAVKFV